MASTFKRLFYRMCKIRTSRIKWQLQRHVSYAAR